MRDDLKRNSVAVSLLTLMFWWAFGFAKHDPRLRSIIPFGEDPYDSVSSFAVIAAILLAPVCLLRTFFPRFVGRSGRRLYVLRAQLAVPMCVFVTLVAEAIAMIRHTSPWISSPARNEILLLLAVQGGTAVATLFLFHREASRPRQYLSRKAILPVGLMISLAAYPERLILSTGGHLLTVVFGAALLFTAVATLVQAWLPGPLSVPSGARDKRLRIFRLGLALLTGAFVGAAACMGELSESGLRLAAPHLLFIASIYAGLGAAGLVIGYLAFGRLLGFVVDEPKSRYLAH